MIRNLIRKFIQEKKEVRVYCQMGQSQYACVSGVITSYGAENDSICLMTSLQQETLIPMTAVHSITSK